MIKSSLKDLMNLTSSKYQVIGILSHTFIVCTIQTVSHGGGETHLRIPQGTPQWLQLHIGACNYIYMLPGRRPVYSEEAQPKEIFKVTCPRIYSYGLDSNL